jgi:glutamyl-Q tRNA(Asp) synthetase
VRSNALTKRDALGLNAESNEVPLRRPRASAARRVFRFAPSPNGFLHLGHAYSALLNFELARACGGRFLLRVEDIDLARARPEFEAAIYEDLAWLGLEWERPVRRQSEHFGDYAEALTQLDALGLLYPCACTRGEIAKAAGQGAPRDPEGAPLYPGTCRAGPRLPVREALQRSGIALRLDMKKAMNLLDESPGAVPLSWREFGVGAVKSRPEQWGDVVLARKDTPASYHLAVVVDDALQGVTDVVRGKDLFYATGLQRLLQHLLGLPAPDYRHHALLLDTEGEKLSKSRVSKTLRAFRAEGFSPEMVRQAIAAALPSAQP